MLVRFRQDVIDLKPEAVHIIAGTNDIAGNTGAATMETVLSHIQSMVELARAHAIKVIIASIPPAGAFPWLPDKKPVPQIAAINQGLADYALANGFTYVDYYSAMAQPDGAMKAGLASDGSIRRAKAMTSCARSRKKPSRTHSPPRNRIVGSDRNEENRDDLEDKGFASGARDRLSRRIDDSNNLIGLRRAGGTTRSQRKPHSIAALRLQYRAVDDRARPRPRQCCAGRTAECQVRRDGLDPSNRHEWERLHLVRAHPIYLFAGISDLRDGRPACARYSWTSRTIPKWRISATNICSAPPSSSCL